MNKLDTCTRFREEATSALTGLHASLLSWSNWNLNMLVFLRKCVVVNKMVFLIVFFGGGGGGGRIGVPGERPLSKAKTNYLLNHIHCMVSG